MVGLLAVFELLVVLVGYCCWLLLGVLFVCLLLVFVYCDCLLLLGLCADSADVGGVWFVLLGVSNGCGCGNSVVVFIFVVRWLRGENVCLISMLCCLLIVLWVCFCLFWLLPWLGFCLLIVFLWFCCSELIMLIDSLVCVLLWVTIWIWLCLSVMLLVMSLFRFLLLGWYFVCLGWFWLFVYWLVCLVGCCEWFCFLFGFEYLFWLVLLCLIVLSWLFGCLVVVLLGVLC